MSLRLRILLLITAVNVAVLLLVVYVGLQVVDEIAPIGTTAILEGMEVGQARRPLDLEWDHVRFLVRIGADGGGPIEPYAPPGLAAEANEAEGRLKEAIQRGIAGVTRAPNALMVVHPEGTRPYRGYYVGFHPRANEEALATLRSIYVLLCAGTLLLTLGIYLVLSRLVLRPLEELAAASRAVAQGLPPVPVRRPRGQDEMSHLVDNFNRMSNEVYGYQQHLEERVMDSLKRVTAAESRLVVAQRLASTGTLAAGFAHEINNPLGGILNALRRLRNEDLPADRRDEYYELVLDGVDRIRTIVDRILNFTPSTREPAPIDLADVCHRAVALAAHRAEKLRVGLRFEGGGDAPRAVGDPQELTQAVLNLILNAVDAMPEEREPGPGDAGAGGLRGQVTVRVRVAADSGVIEVEDNGQGMDEETRRRCVDFFFSTKPEGEGSGLGLAIVQHIVTDHGGTLDIDSRMQQGTVVRIRVPLCETR